MTAKLFKSDRPVLPTHVSRGASDTLSKKAKEAIHQGPFVERVKQENEAKSPENDLWKRKNYVTGDGDPFKQVPRPGSDRASKLPSKGLST